MRFAFVCQCLTLSVSIVFVCDCLSVCLSICVLLSVFLSVCLFVCLSENINFALAWDLLLSVNTTWSVSIYHCLSDYLVMFLSICLSVLLSVSLSICLSELMYFAFLWHLFCWSMSYTFCLDLSFCLLVCPSICLSTYLPSVCLSKIHQFWFLMRFVYDCQCLTLSVPIYQCLSDSVGLSVYLSVSLSLCLSEFMKFAHLWD